MGIDVSIMGQALKFILNAVKNIDFSKIAIPSIDKEQSINRLINAYRNEELVLVLGAGVSVPYNLLEWKSLLQGLLLISIKKDSKTKATEVHTNPEQLTGNTIDDSNIIVSELFSKVFDISPLIAARYLRNKYNHKPNGIADKKSGTQTFESEVQSLLYASLKKEEEGKVYDSGLIKEIRQLCIAAGKHPNLDSIITYNFDDILEESLSNFGIDIPHKVIYDVGMPPEQDKLPIYHVHGYLPRNGNLGQKHRVIFSEEIYHEQYMDIYNWSNIVQINKFREKTCLFIGVSFSDPNMRRLLDIAQEQRGDRSVQHIVIKKREDVADILKALQGIIEKDKTLKDRLEKDEKKLFEVVNELKRLREDFEEKDAYSFGVATIWVNNFTEIDKIVHRIRKMANADKESK